MINSIDFVNRLKKVMISHQLTASNFADKIGVQRSSISHILSGRNKPSLDFILKITSTFTEVDIYWLLNGKGTYPSNKKNTPPTLPTPILENTVSIKKGTGKSIQRIVVFYNDGTFDEFTKN